MAKGRKRVCRKEGGSRKHVRYLLIDCSLRRIVSPSTLPMKETQIPVQGQTMLHVTHTLLLPTREGIMENTPFWKGSEHPLRVVSLAPHSPC